MFISHTKFYFKIDKKNLVLRLSKKRFTEPTPGTAKMVPFYSHTRQHIERNKRKKTDTENTKDWKPATVRFLYFHETNKFPSNDTHEKMKKNELPILGAHGFIEKRKTNESSEREFVCASAASGATNISRFVYLVCAIKRNGKKCVLFL